VFGGFLKSTDSELDAFKELLASKGLRLTHQRRAIAEVFFSGKKHLSLLELLDLAKAEYASIGYATVYRTMRLLTEGGLATEHKFGENHTRYEPNVEGDHHDHLICVTCGKITEFEDELIERQQDLIAMKFGFEVVSHRHEVYVRCVPPCEEQAADS
jgi:Fur family ferric uptake transcriptional regulator